ncbi:MAG TPA: 50S ribosomal protein L25, partial [Candidatus Angelobacter sp.]|nr:50S ribosomal protein L25 [Candidatus Angelobacter sp.]
QVLRVADLDHGGKLKFITEETQAVAHITSVKEEVAATPDAAAAAGPSEPEVIKKGKQDAEEGAETPAKK